MTTQSKRWERLKAAAMKPNRQNGKLPLEYWIGRGNPLNPYLRGRIIWFRRKELKPKEIRLPPEQLCFEGEVVFNEHTLILNWVKQWLKWVQWYWTIAYSPDVTIDQLFDAPICATTWKRTNKDVNLIKFGLLWKAYDMAAGWSLSTTPNWILDNKTIIQFDRWILGGYSGSDFIMAPLDLSSKENKESRYIRI